jgi:predicted nucleic acid-binding protein
VTAVVVDASAIVEYLFLTAKAHRISTWIESRAADLHVPEHCDLEVLQALRRPLRSGRLPAARTAEAVEDYLDLPLTRHRHVGLLERVLDLRDNFTAYDAVYVALAELLDAVIVTADGPFERAVRRHTEVDVLVA